MTTAAALMPPALSRTRYLLIAAISLSAALFTLVVPGGGAVSALVLAIVGLATVLLFWAGLTLPFIAAAAVI